MNVSITTVSSSIDNISDGVETLDTSAQKYMYGQEVPAGYKTPIIWFVGRFLITRPPGCIGQVEESLHCLRNGNRLCVVKFINTRTRCIN